MAGIQVGEVTEIELSGDRARVTIRVKNDIPLRANACLTKRFPSALLPDALLEASVGSAPAELLRDLPAERREITCVREAANVAKLMESLSKIATDIQVVSADLAQTVGGTQGSVREIIENLTAVTRSVDRLLEENSARVAGILKNAEALHRGAPRGRRAGRGALPLHREERRRGQPAAEPDARLGRGHRRLHGPARPEGIGPGRAPGPPEAQPDARRRAVDHLQGGGRAGRGREAARRRAARREGGASPPRASPTT